MMSLHIVKALLAWPLRPKMKAFDTHSTVFLHPHNLKDKYVRFSLSKAEIRGQEGHQVIYLEVLRDFSMGIKDKPGSTRAHKDPLGKPCVLGGEHDFGREAPL